jgi:predicted nuclease of predicted toxin-antitoxin system
MRILIDECLDWRLGRALTGHDCVSVQKMGWGGIKNGRLLALAQEEFDVFLTADRNLSFQQNTTKFQIAVVVLVAGSTQLFHSWIELSTTGLERSSVVIQTPKQNRFY